MNAQTRRRDRRKLPTAVLALVVLGLVLGSLAAGIFKPQITTALKQLTGAETREAYFAANQFVLEDVTTVKLAGVDVGVVSDIERLDEGGALVTMVVNDDVVRAVGAQPAARWRPNTLLGGKMNIELVPGGDRTAEWVDPIPVERTRLPMEVDDLIETFQPDALEGSKAAVTQFDATLAAGGTDALKSLLATAPDTFRPGAGVIEAFRGTRPDADLRELALGLQQAGAVLTRKEGQLDAIVATLQDTSSALADTSPAFAEAVDKLPAALDNADRGLTRLNTTLDKLEDTAGPTRPIVQELEDLLDRLEPVLREGRPVFSDLRESLDDLRPLLEDLTPVGEDVTVIFGEKLPASVERLNGPVLDVAYAGYHGVGPFANTASDTPFNEALGHMFVGLSRAGGYVDPNGHAVAFQPGPGSGTLSGAGDFSGENLLQEQFQGGGN
ncbi:MAG: MlaD family protein [Pseudonocardia sp.]